MKKLVSIIFIFITYIQFSYSQDVDSRKEMNFGFKACINYSSAFEMKTDNSNIKGKPGFAGGAFISIPIVKYLGIQTEVLLSQKGFKSTGIYKHISYELKRTSNFIDIPFMLAFKPIEELTILFGPQYSYLMSQTDVLTHTDLTIPQQKEFKNENTKRSIFCLTGGLDFNFNSLVLGMRIGWDLKHNKDFYLSPTPSYKNIWLQTSVGFRIY